MQQQMPPQGQPIPQQAQGPMPAAQPQQPAAGPQPVQETGFNQDIQNVLFSRLQALSPEEGDIIADIFDEMIDEQTLPILVKVFPEMKILFEQASMFDQQEQPGAIQGGGQQMPMQQGGQAPGQRNPLVDDSVSKGLTGRY